MQLLLLCGALLAAPALASMPIPASIHTSAATKVAVFFNHETTFTQLTTIKQEVLQDGIDLEYDRLEFDKNGYLTKISFHIDYGGYTQGSAANDNLTDNFSFGFVGEFTPGAKPTFRIAAPSK